MDENNNVITQTDGTDTLRFVYDSNGAPVYMEYNGTVYYYEKNLQGDIVGILDTSGTTVVQYSYDIWGKLLGITGDLADTIGTANPLRYRGYYYDTETELYYLQSRYYSPELMRFISIDDAALSNAQGEPIGSNLYAYCLNNPVMNSDPSGKFVTATTGALLGAFLSAVTYFVEYWLGMRTLNWWHLAGIVAAGAALGAIGGYISGWAKFAKLAKYAKLPKHLAKLKNPLVRNLVTISVKGIKFVINSYIKKLTLKPGESWMTAVRRWLNV